MKQSPLSLAYNTRQGSSQSDPKELEEYNSTYIDLGSESPRSVLKLAIEGDDHATKDDWAKSGIAVHTSVPPRSPIWRSASFGKKQLVKRQKLPELADFDCGICFENAVHPCKTACCGRTFCSEHLSDWLYGRSSDGRCPSCRTLYSLALTGVPGGQSQSSPSTDDRDSDSDSESVEYRTPRRSPSPLTDDGSHPHHQSPSLGASSSRPMAHSAHHHAYNPSHINTMGTISKQEFNQVLSLVAFTSILFVLKSYREG